MIWIAAAIVIFGLCVDNGLSNIAKAIAGKYDTTKDPDTDKKPEDSSTESNSL